MQETIIKQLEALGAELEERMELAKSSHLPVSRYILLAGDDSVDVRYQLASNPNIPSLVLDILCQDETSSVAARAKQTMDDIDSGKVEAEHSIFHFGQAALDS